jgi:3,4-dihydroxy 2-butanone 4-phosphate synthase/GTP cyclohydrolase II
MAQIQSEGSGVIIYLDQEGRDCGLASKAKGYALTQTKNIDTFEAYNELGLKDDAREYNIVIDILRFLGLSSIRLLTNNPRKISPLVEVGIQVERVPLIIQPTPQTSGYLAAKKRKGHLL